MSQFICFKTDRIFKITEFNDAIFTLI